jgi:hypothetical protein
MTSIFDGMAAMMAATFGQPVTITRGAAAPVTVHGVFREVPEEVPGADGRMVISVTPILQVPANVSVPPERNDVVGVGARQFVILSRTPSASPADDRMIVCLLEET